MISDIVMTFLELGDATSRNLGFSHQRDVHISYGEPTITETNLLEIRRRHSGRVRLETFKKNEEAQNGADFDWHIIGNKWTLKMRVQAKRARSKGGLDIKYKVKSSGKHQRELLLKRAKADNVRPLYCFYCTKPMRTIRWHPEEFETGCLLADANDVHVTITKLSQIEHKCIPWHYLFQRADFARCKPDGLSSAHVARVFESDSGTTWRNVPTIADLNGDGDDDFDHTGVHATIGEELHHSILSKKDHAGNLDRTIHRRLLIDVGDRE